MLRRRSLCSPLVRMLPHSTAVVRLPTVSTTPNPVICDPGSIPKIRTEPTTLTKGVAVDGVAARELTHTPLRTRPIYFPASRTNAAPPATRGQLLTAVNSNSDGGPQATRGQ